MISIPNVRSLIVDLTPPVLLRLAQRSRRRIRYLMRRRTAAFAATDVGNGYDSDEYAGQIVANKLRAVKPEPYDHRSGRLILPLIVCRFLDQPLTVLDFGGSAATGLFSILDQIVGLDLAKLSYVLVDTPAMCQAVRGKIAPRMPLAFKILDDIPASLSAPLIVNMDSSIQYLPAYRETLTKLTSLAPHYIIVSRTPMTDGPTYIRDEPHPYKKIATRVPNRSEFIAEMGSLGYGCIYQIDHDAGQSDEGGTRVSTSIVFRPYSNL